MSGTPPAAEAADRPVLRIVRGAPTAEELAALVVVLAGRGGEAPAEPAPAVRSLWAAPVLRAPLSPGPGAWRASALPVR